MEYFETPFRAAARGSLFLLVLFLTVSVRVGYDDGKSGYRSSSKMDVRATVDFLLAVR